MNSRESSGVFAAETWDALVSGDLAKAVELSSLPPPPEFTATGAPGRPVAQVWAESPELPAALGSVWGPLVLPRVAPYLSLLSLQSCLEQVSGPPLPPTPVLRALDLAPGHAPHRVLASVVALESAYRSLPEYLSARARSALGLPFALGTCLDLYLVQSPYVAPAARPAGSAAAPVSFLMDSWFPDGLEAGFWVDAPSELPPVPTLRALLAGLLALRAAGAACRLACVLAAAGVNDALVVDTLKGALARPLNARLSRAAVVTVRRLSDRAEHSRPRRP